MTRCERGITLTEMVVVVAILATSIGLVRVGIKFLNTVARQKAVAEAQQETEGILYAINREIRNSAGVLVVSSDTLRLRVFDFHRFGYNDPNIASAINLGTVTYRYQESNGDHYLLRIREMPGQLTNVRPLMKNRIGTPSVNSPLFVGDPANGPPFDKVDVALSIQFPLLRGSSFTYRTEVMIRSLGNSN
jgi:hypothetical protein